MVRQQQELFYEQRYIASKFHRTVDWLSIATAFDICAYDLAAAPDMELVLVQAMATVGPVLIRVPIDETINVMPMVAPGGANTNALDSVA
jgi:acetolactate synthase I/II/III large subunit